MILEGADARAGARAAQRAGWRTHNTRWHCPLCLSHLDGAFPPEPTKGRVEETVFGMTLDDLTVLHGAVVAELRQRARPTITYVPQPMSMTCRYAGAFAFTDPNGRPARCQLAVYTGRGRLPLAVVVEDPANPGASVTNSSEELATAIWHDLLPGAADGFMLVEVYLDPTRKNADLRERWAVVA